jgi:heme A synthase
VQLSEIHRALANSVVIYAGAAAIIGLIAYFRRRGMESSYWGILIIGELLFIAQAIIGLVLWISGGEPGRIVHILYGVVAVISLPGYFALSKGKDDRDATLAYALICLFLVGVGLRAAFTAQVQ